MAGLPVLSSAAARDMCLTWTTAALEHPPHALQSHMHVDCDQHQGMLRPPPHAGHSYQTGVGHWLQRGG